MTPEALLHLAAYGFLVRMIVEFVQIVFKISGRDHPRLVQAVVAAVAAVFVYLLGVNPVGLMGLNLSAVGVSIKPIGVALLAGAAASTNDLLDLLPRLGKR